MYKSENILTLLYIIVNSYRNGQFQSDDQENKHPDKI